MTELAIDGGMVLTDDELLAERARLLHNIGRAEGEPGYKHYVLSSNYRMPELAAAHLLGQFEAFPAEHEQRQRGHRALRAALRDVEGIRIRPDDARITSRGFYEFDFRYEGEKFDGIGRDRLVEALSAEGVPCWGSYGLPLYEQPAFSREEVGRLVGDPDVPPYRHLHLPGTEAINGAVVALPHELLLADPEEMELVADALRKLRANADRLA